MPCIALFKVDSAWYRALITKCEADPITKELEIKVKYVDYGNEEIVDITRYRIFINAYNYRENLFDSVQK